MQTVGAATIASAQPTDSNFQTKQNQGKDIVLVGLAIQIIFFGFFSIIAVRFHFTGKQLALPEDQLIMHAGGNKRRLKANWGQLLAAVNFGCLCIMVSGHFFLPYTSIKAHIHDRHGQYTVLLDSPKEQMDMLIPRNGRKLIVDLRICQILLLILVTQILGL